MHTDALPEMLSVTQAAEELRIGRRAVIHRIHAGTLTATKIGAGTSAYVIARTEVERAKVERAKAEQAPA